MADDTIPPEIVQRYKAQSPIPADIVQKHQAQAPIPPEIVQKFKVDQERPSTQEKLRQGGVEPGLFGRLDELISPEKIGRHIGAGITSVFGPSVQTQLEQRRVAEEKIRKENPGLDEFQIGTKLHKELGPNPMAFFASPDIGPGARMGNIAKTVKMSPEEIAVEGDTARLKEFVNRTSDKLHAGMMGNQVDVAEAMDSVKALPKEFQRGPELDREFYFHREEGTPLTPEKQRLYDTHAQPVVNLDENTYVELVQKRAELAGQKIPERQDILTDPRYIHQIAQGYGHPFDEPTGSLGYDTFSGGIGGRTLSAVSPGIKAQRLVTLVDDQGNRAVVDFRTKGFKENGKKVGTLARGMKVEDQSGKKFTVDRSLVREKEEQTAAQEDPVTYHTSFFGNMWDNILKNKRAIRNIDNTLDLRSEAMDKEWMFKADEKGVPPHYRTTSLPQFQGYKMEPRIAYMLDDFNKPGLLGDTATEVLGKVNRALVTSIFLNPISTLTGHGENLLNQWYASRGFENFMPKTWGRSVRNGLKALDQVRTLGDDYRKFATSGSSLQYMGIEHRNYHEIIMKALGHQVESHIKDWEEIFKAWSPKGSLITAKDILNKLANFSSKELWFSNDVFMLQRIYDLMEGKGMNMQQAIKEAERIIPSYRIPSVVAEGVLGLKGGRLMSQFLQDPNLLLFSRWHYSWLKSMGEIMKGLTRNNKDDLGKLLAVASTIPLYKLGDLALQQALPDSRLRRAGIAGTLDRAWALSQGQSDFKYDLGTYMQFTPLISAGAGILQDVSSASGNPALMAKSVIGRGIESVEPGREFVDVAMGRKKFSDLVQMWFGLQPEQAAREAGANKAARYRRGEQKGLEKHYGRMFEPWRWGE